MRIEDLLVMRGKSEVLAFMEGDNQDTGLDGGHGRGDEGFRGACSHVRTSPRFLVLQKQHGGDILIPLELEVDILGVGVCEATGVSSPDSPLMVDVDEDRVKVCVKGARWVSFNSIGVKHSD
jgi:hypothetical protein